MLRAVDDMLVEQGYAALTMKGIAERAGVGRQTVYRWWNNKAEILMEASRHDAEDELIAPPRADAEDELTSFLELVARFLTVSPAGLSYRALLGEAQYDPAVAALVGDHDPIRDSAQVVLGRIRDDLVDMPPPQIAVAELVGPVLYRVLVHSGGKQAGEPTAGVIADHVRNLINVWSSRAPTPGPSSCEPGHGTM